MRDKKKSVRNKNILMFVFVLILIVSFGGSVLAVDYYVSTDGNDSNLGTEAQPWRTIQKAADTINGGDICIVGDGVYNERVIISRSGSEGNVMIFQAQNKWSAIVDFSAQSFLVSGDYIKLEGFRIQGHIFASQYAALAVTGNHNIITNMYGYNNEYTTFDIGGSSNTLSSSYIHYPQFGIIVAGLDNIIEDNEVYGLEQWVASTDTDYLRFFGSNHIMRGNIFHGANVSRLTALGAHIDCFQTFEQGAGISSYNIFIEDNYCADCAEGVMASATLNYLSDGLIIRNNIFVNCGSYCIVPYGFKNVRIHNNICVSNNGLYGIQCYDNSTCDIQNNIIYDVSSPWYSAYAINTGSTWIADAGKNNLIYSQYMDYTGYYVNDIINQDPLFVNSINDYHLQPTSPAIDTGTDLSTYFTTDFDGVTRPQGPAWDIGAYEFIQTTDTSPPLCSSPSPTTNLSSGTTQTTISLTTDETANCRYSETAGTSYGSMTDIFSVTDSTSHSTLVSGLTDGQNYNFYVRCNDTSGNFNTDDFLISFGVDSVATLCGPADTDIDGVVSITEIMAYITEWKAGNVDIVDLMAGITEWKNGCG